MIKLYKYVYSFNPKDIAQYNDVFHVEEFLVKEEQDFNELDGWKIDCKNTYWFANIDDGISKDAVDDWKELEYHNNGRHGWSFKNDKETMEAAIDMAESGHLVIGTLHTKSCAETIDRMINFYEVRDQAQIKYMLSAILKLVVSQRLLPGIDGKLVLIPEVMVVDNIVSGIIRKEKISVSEIEDAIQSASEKGSIGLINSLAKCFVDGKITLEQAKSQIEEKNIEILNRTIMQLKVKPNIPQGGMSGMAGY